MNKGKRRPHTTTSKPLTRNEDEEAADGCSKNGKHDQHRNGSPIQSLADKGLTDLVEVEEGVLAVPNKGDDGVEHILMGEDEVDGNGKRKDELSAC
jgi:hypothetical protein